MDDASQIETVSLSLPLCYGHKEMCFAQQNQEEDV